MAVCFFVFRGQNDNSTKNKIISNIQSAIPPKIVTNIVPITIALNGCLWIYLVFFWEIQKSVYKNKHSVVICKIICKFSVQPKHCTIISNIFRYKIKNAFQPQGEKLPYLFTIHYYLLLKIPYTWDWWKVKSEEWRVKK